MLAKRMEEEIWEQPEALAANSDRYLRQLREMVAGKSFDMVLLVARGSSDNAALYARYLIEITLRVPVCLAAPSVLTQYGAHVHYPPSLVVGVSQSGSAPDVAEVLAAAKGQGHATVAITNTPESLVTEAASHTLLLGVGEEVSVAATKTYTASLLALHQLVRACTDALAAPTLPTEADCSAYRLAAETALPAVLRSDQWFALARGLSYCSAHETALKMMECALLPFKAFSTADFQHGPRALAGPGSVAVVYGPVPESLNCEVVCAPGPPGPISEVLFGQWLALLAARARGYDPDQPANLTKVTRTR